MREELKKYVAQEHELDQSDLAYTLWLVEKFSEAMSELTMAEQKKVLSQNLSEENEWAYIDDINYYRYVEQHYIWHFGLWRMQGVLEGVILTSLLMTVEGKNFHGLKLKLDAMRQDGYTIEENDYAELLDWGRLRNKLSHFPPQGYNPGPLMKEDLIEYSNLCERLIKQWTLSKESLKNSKS